MKHTAFIEFEVKDGETEMTPEEREDWKRYTGKDETHRTLWHKERTTSEQDEVQSTIDYYLADPDTYLSEVSCASGCKACAAGERSPFV
jgi:hypothetical protein